VLQRVAGSHDLRRDQVSCSVLQCVAVCCSAWLCDAVCCSVLQCVTASNNSWRDMMVWGSATVSRID